jgi:type IV secretory pathway ATPase VirB11/archaellum biosynthesis ATPase
VQQQVADSIMHLVSESMRRREAEAVVRELEDVYDWRQLYALNGGSISVFVVHANRIKERIIELEATISKEGAADA